MPQPVPYGAVIYAKDYRLLAKFHQLVILQIPERIAANITIDKPPRKRENTPIKLFLNVSSIESARHAARLLGGELNGPEKEWKFHGIKRCDGIDPERNVFQLQEVSV